MTVGVILVAVAVVVIVVDIGSTIMPYKYVCSTDRK